MFNPNQAFVVIRNYQPGDGPGCNKVMYEGTMSTVATAFFTALTREVTLQIVVITAAIMFVFMGLSPSLCLLSIPVTVIIMYLTIYIVHLTKAYVVSSSMVDVPKTFMSAQDSGFWVAEAFEPLSGPADIQYDQIIIVNENEADISVQEGGAYDRKIIGTIAVSPHKADCKSAWLKWMAINSNYRRKGIAAALLQEVLKFCKETGYEDIDLVTTEFHDAARELFLKKGFELRHMYHKQVLGSVLQVLMYELSFRIARPSHKLD